MEKNNKAEEIKNKIETEPNFINSKKHQYSLSGFLEQHPNGTTDNIIAYFLCITPEDVKNIYYNAVEKIRQKMKVVVK
jgi:hypothetical protein